jgi:hypothetical protein
LCALANLIHLQVFYSVDEDLKKKHQAQKERQDKQQSVTKRRRSSSSSTTNSARSVRQRVADAAAGGELEASGGEAAADEADAADPADCTLNDEAKSIIQAGVLKVCPRNPNGQFKQKSAFNWPKGWDAFLRGVTAKVTALPRYANADKELLSRSIGTVTTQ